MVSFTTCIDKMDCYKLNVLRSLLLSQLSQLSIV